MLKFVRVCVLRAFKNGVPEAVLDGAQGGVVYRRGFWSGGKCERLDFDFSQVMPLERHLVQRRIMT